MIAREGLWVIIPLLLVSVIIQHKYGLYALPGWVLVLLVIYLFRQSSHAISSSPLAILSPADGRVVAIEKIHDAYLDRDAQRITLQMGLFDVYSLWSVTEGKLKGSWTHPPGSSTTEKLRALWIQTDEADDVVVEIYPSRSGRVVCYGVIGDRIGQGKKCGLSPFGSRINVFLPVSSPINVVPGQRVKAGNTVLAKWPRA